MNVYYQLDSSLKPYFVYKFWKTLDPTPETETNEYRDLFFERLEYVNEHYASVNLEGWQTDMGRVYMLYGKPDDIDSEPTGISSLIDVEESTFQTEPVEAWIYYSEGFEGGEAVFIFVDFDTDGMYNIFSSTEPGFGRLTN